MIFVIGYIIIVYVVFFIISKNRKKLHFNYNSSDINDDSSIAIVFSVLWIVFIPICLLVFPIYLIYKRYE